MQMELISLLMFLDLLVLLVIGGFLGWVLELFFKRLFSMKKWVNPGFLTGPIVPLYGFGVVFLYLIGLLPFDTWGKIIIIAVSLSALEYFVGLFFLKVMHVRLWDYRNMRGNLKGLIAPLFSVIWAVLGYIFLYYINPPFLSLLSKIHLSNFGSIIYLLLGVTYGFIIVDFLHSINITAKIRSVAAKAKETIVYEKFKVYMSEQDNKKKKFIIPLKASENIKENVIKFLNPIKKIIYKDELDQTE